MHAQTELGNEDGTDFGNENETPIALSRYPSWHGCAAFACCAFCLQSPRGTNDWIVRAKFVESNNRDGIASISRYKRINRWRCKECARQSSAALLCCWRRRQLAAARAGARCAGGHASGRPEPITLGRPQPLAPASFVPIAAPAPAPAGNADDVPRVVRGQIPPNPPAFPGATGPAAVPPGTTPYDVGVVNNDADLGGFFTRVGDKLVSACFGDVGNGCVPAFRAAAARCSRAIRSSSTSPRPSPTRSSLKIRVL